MHHKNGFRWPKGKRAAVSLSFDDARLTQIDVGIPTLNQFRLRATFYVSFRTLEQRLDGWREALKAGHEVGNHTVNHPCTCNFSWSATRALEDYTLKKMAWELDEANARIRKLLGVRAKSFAYPCGQSYVGRGRNVKSYVPLVAERFLVGRGFPNETPNDPVTGDLAQAMGVDFDCKSFASIREWLEAARLKGGWIIFVGHEMGPERRQSVSKNVLTRLCRYLADSEDLWVDTVANIGGYIQKAR